MKTKMLLLAALVAQTAQAELFISEYVEGSGSNKAIEIYNPADVAVDLSSYQLKMYHNGGSAPASGKDFKLSGSIPAKGTLVLVDSQAGAALKAMGKADVIGSSNFNGDDAIALYKNNVLIDVFGQIGVDPGAYWGTKDNPTADRTLVRKATVSKGDTNGNDAFDPSLEWDFFPIDTFANLGSHNSTGGGGGGGGGGGTPDPEIPPAGTCGDAATLISAVQGNSTASPMVGSTVTVEAVVTMVAPHAKAFFVQEEAADQDNDNNTSEAIFVNNGSLTDYPKVGEKVRVTGKVEESDTKTNLRRSGLTVCGTATIPDAVSFSLPISSIADYEAREGMLIRSNQTLVVSDHYSYTQYGELTLAPEILFIPTNLYRPGTPEAIARADLNKRSRLILDDLDATQYPAQLKYPAPGLSAYNTVRLGDQVNNISGVLDYFKGWRMMPIGDVQFTQLPRPVKPELPGTGSLRVASANVLNYFNGDGLGGGFPTSRGATTAQELERQAAKTVDALASIDADIVALMEIENDGYGVNSALAELVGRLNERVGANTYSFVKPANLNQLGTDQITVAIIYKPAKVAPVGAAATTTAGVFGYGNRPPLAQTFRELSSNEVFTVVANHFKSKSPSGATGDNVDKGDGQSAWNALRVQAATELKQWLSTKPTGHSDADVLIVGDLNAYAKEDPIMTLRDGGFVDLIEKFQQNTGYSYLFGGEVGYLDHALASGTLANQVTYAMEYHINAVEPEALDYNIDKKTSQQVSDWFAPHQYRAADHDPVVLELALNGFHPADLDKDGDIDSNDITLFTRLLQSGKTTQAHDFNKDGVVNVADSRAMTALCTRARCAVK